MARTPRANDGLREYRRLMRKTEKAPRGSAARFDLFTAALTEAARSRPDLVREARTTPPKEEER